MRSVRLIVSAMLTCLAITSSTFAQNGACCNPDGTCAEFPNDIGMAICSAVGGTWLGNDTSCIGADCHGACQLIDECIEDLSQQSCQDLGGKFLGPGSTCPIIPVGACCMPDGSCMDEQIESECEDIGGSYQGDDTECAGIVCQPTGACCIAETGECIDGFTEFECKFENPFGTGTWQGAGTDCSDTGCPLFGFGACCYPDGFCDEFVDEGDCLANGGTYGGDNSLCTDLDCCTWDVTGDGFVNVFDLLDLLSHWGPCPPAPAECPWDFNESSAVDVNDLLELLANYGAPC